MPNTYGTAPVSSRCANSFTINRQPAWLADDPTPVCSRHDLPGESASGAIGTSSQSFSVAAIFLAAASGCRSGEIIDDGLHEFPPGSPFSSAIVTDGFGSRYRFAVPGPALIACTGQVWMHPQQSSQ